MPNYGECRRYHCEVTDKNYGGYIVNLGVSLCTSCSPDYNEMCRRHLRELEEYLNAPSTGMPHEFTESNSASSRL